MMNAVGISVSLGCEACAYYGNCCRRRGAPVNTLDSGQAYSDYSRCSAKSGGMAGR